MNKAEFDKFAEEYSTLLQESVKISDEAPEFFAAYKIADISKNVVDSVKEKYRILDFGSGIGNSIPYFKKYFQNSLLTCADISEKSLSIAQQRFPDMAEHVHFEKMPLPFDNEEFDIVFAACVFHHISHSEFSLIFQEFNRILAPNGIAIIFEHNPYNPLTQKAVQLCPFDENAILITAKDLSSHIRSGGLLPQKTVYRIFFLAFLRICRPLERYMGWLPLGAQYYICAKKTQNLKESI